MVWHHMHLNSSDFNVSLKFYRKSQRHNHAGQKPNQTMKFRLLLLLLWKGLLKVSPWVVFCNLCHYDVHKKVNFEFQNNLKHWLLCFLKNESILPKSWKQFFMMFCKNMLGWRRCMIFVLNLWTFFERFRWTYALNNTFEPIINLDWDLPNHVVILTLQTTNNSTNIINLGELI